MYSVLIFIVLILLSRVETLRICRNQPMINKLYMNSAKTTSISNSGYVKALGIYSLWKSFDKESNRKFRRTVFTTQDWKNHRNSDRYFSGFLSMPFSVVLRGLTSQALILTLWAFIVCGYNLLVLKNLSLFKFALPLMSLPTLPVSLISPSLGLLLVFRTNTAYSRWEKASITWSTTIMGKSFDLMRQSALLIKDPSIKVSIFRYIIAFSKTLKWHLGHQEKDRLLSEDLIGLLSTKEASKLMSCKYRVQHILNNIAELVSRGGLTPNAQSHMDRTICDLTESFFTCDRIFTTPIPLMYTKHTARFLILWLFTVPMALFHEFHAAKIPYPIIFVPLITFFQCIFLFGIEDVGVSIEEPFSILPMANLCNNIQNMGKELLEESNLKLEPPAEPLAEPEPVVAQPLLDLITLSLNPSNTTATTAVTAATTAVTVTAAAAAAAAVTDDTFERSSIFQPSSSSTTTSSTTSIIGDSTVFPSVQAAVSAAIAQMQTTTTAATAAVTVSINEPKLTSVKPTSFFDNSTFVPLLSPELQTTTTAGGKSATATAGGGGSSIAQQQQQQQ